MRLFEHDEFPQALLRAAETLFPDESLRPQLEAEYEEQCRLLFATDDYPSFEEVLTRFVEIRKLL